jgi:NADPH:quinone reductase-like Zn-dependent oxidoreductase
LKRLSHKINKAGNINDLNLIEEELPPPNENEVQISIRSIGLNFADIFALTGLYSATPKGSFIPGLEYSGEIIQIGNNVKDYQLGDRVMGVTRFGAYTTIINSNPLLLNKIPNSWTWDEGAAFITQALTAYYALIELGNLKKGNIVLIHSAAGGVGIYANRIAKAMGAITIGSVGSEKKYDLLKTEGYDYWICRTSNFFNDMKEILNGRSLNLVLECIGGQIFIDSYNLLGSSGRLVTYGSANFTPKSNHPDWIQVAWNYLTRPKIDPLQMTTENKSVMGFNLIWMWDHLEKLKIMVDEILGLNLPPQIVGKTFPFNDAKKALEYFKEGSSIGKIILTVED